MSDYLGRRYSITVGCLIFSVGVIIQMACEYSWRQIAIGRLVTGVAIGQLSAAVPVYQSETVPRQVRGALVGTYQLFVTLGILLSYVTCYGTHKYGDNGMKGDANPVNTGALYPTAQWRVPIGLGFAWALILGVGILFCPESPRWLARNNSSDDRILRSLSVVRGVEDQHPAVAAEFYDIKQELEEERALPPKGWLDCLRPEEKTLYRTVLGMALQTGQQLTGANYFFYFGVTIFQPVGISDPYIIQIILGGVNTGCTFWGLWALDRLGRRICLMFGALWMFIWLIVFATVGTASSTNGEDIPRWAGTVMVVSTCLFIFAFAGTWGPGVWSAIAEFVNPATRTKQYALATMSNWIWNFNLAFFTSPITSSIHFRYGYVFAACCLANFLIVYFFLYETANLSLEAANLMYNEKGVYAWNSRKWAPPGFVSRTQAQEEHVRDAENMVNAVHVADEEAGKKQAHSTMHQSEGVQLQNAEL